MAEAEKRLSLPTLAGDGLLLACALAGFTSSFLSLYGDATMGGLVSGQTTALSRCLAWRGTFLFTAVLFALMALCAWSLPRFRGAAVGALSALLGAAAALNWDTVIQGGGLTVHIISYMFSRRVGGGVFLYDPGLTQSEENFAVRLFLLLAMAALALALGWAVVRARRWWIVLLLTLPPLLHGLLADLYPHWPSFMALASCWCAMLLMDLCKWAAPASRGKLTLVTLPCTAAVLAVITLAFPREGYTRPQWALEAHGNLMVQADRAADFFSQFDGPFRRRVTYVGAAEEADLAGAGPLNYTGRTVLRVKSDYAGRLYLRGSSLAAYEDGVWKALPEGAYQAYLDSLSANQIGAFSPLLFPAAQGLPGEQYTVTVENLGAAGSCVYVPYYPEEQEWSSLGMLPVEDACFAHRQGQRSFTVTFRDRQPAGGAMRAGDSYLQTVVRTHYLDMPEEYAQSLADLYWTRYGFIGPDPVLAAQRAAELLDELCEYDPEAPAAPEGSDPVLYFLNEGRRGYCMHFASAAALMLRSLGIPARYVSGFTAESMPGQEIAVPDRAAHAWVEVWVDGFGWHPVEVTPAAAFAWYEQGVADDENFPSAPPEESEEPEPTPTPVQSLAPSEPPSAPQGEEEAGPAGAFDWSPLLAAARALAVSAGALSLLWLGQYLPKKLRARRLRSPDRNRAALEGYGCLLRMERWGGRVDGRALELAQKARFSQHTLTEEELDELRRLVDRERERLCVILDPLPRLAFRYFWGAPARPKPGKNRENAENHRENGA